MAETDSAKYNEIVTSLDGKYTKVMFASTAFVRDGYVYCMQSATMGIGYTNQIHLIGYSLGGTDKPEIIDENLMVISYRESGDTIAFVGDLDTIKNLAISIVEQSNKQI